MTKKLKLGNVALHSNLFCSNVCFNAALPVRSCHANDQCKHTVTVTQLHHPQARRQGDDALRETPRSFATPQTCPVLRHLSPARNMAFAGIERISILARHLQQRQEARRVTDQLKAAMYVLQRQVGKAKTSYKNKAENNAMWLKFIVFGILFWFMKLLCGVLLCGVLLCGIIGF